MNAAINNLRVGLFFIFGITLIYIVYTTLSHTELTKEDGYHITAVFNDLSAVSPDAEIRLAGVRIGRVESTELSNGQGLATLLINKQYKEIPKDSIATIAMNSLLGQGFISIKYGTPETGFLKANDLIATQERVSMDSVVKEIGQLGKKLNKIADGIQGQGGDNLFINLNKMVKENSEKLKITIDNLSIVTANLADGKGTIGKLINEDEAYTELMTAITEIKHAAGNADETFAHAKEVFAKVKNGEGSLGKLLTDDTIANDLQVTASNLKDFSNKINSEEGTIGKLVNDDTLYLELRNIMNKADQTLNSVGDSGPLSVLGTAGNTLF